MRKRREVIERVLLLMLILIVLNIRDTPEDNMSKMNSVKQPQDQTDNK